MTSANVKPREWIRKVLIYHQKVSWPRENIARAKFYFSLILKATKNATPPTKVLQPSNIGLSSTYSGTAQLREAQEYMSREKVAEVFRKEAKTVLDELIPQDRSKLLYNNPKGVAPEAVLYDYMAPWGYRVVVQQVPDYSKALAMCRTSIS